MFRLSNYWALGLLIFIPYALYMSKKSLADLSAWRRWSTFGLRSIIILLLVLSLAGFKLIWKVDKLCVIFALDTSSSIPEAEIQRASGFIAQALESMEETDEAGLIVFGSEAYVELPPKMKPEISVVSSAPSGEYTNLESAVRVAMDLFTESSQKRIVLMTDGNENAGNVMNEATVANSIGVQIYTVPLSSRGTGAPEVLMDGLIGPGSAALGRAFQLKAIVRSTVDTAATLRLFRDRDYLSEERIEVAAGKRQMFTFQQTLDTEGTHVYEVLIEPATDTIRENNRAKALMTTTGKPKVLYLSRETAYPDYLRRALVQKGMEVTLLTEPSGMPTSLSELQSYSAVVFNDISAYSFSAAQMEMMESYVHDLGGGFVMVGGENSFGGGGYQKTPVEQLLPVKMVPERKKRSLSIVLAIDRSGSMAAQSGRYAKIELAKEAASSVVELLTDKDQMGIIAFDAAAQEIVKLAKVESKGEIEDKIAAIRVGGGTNIYPALEMAHEWLRSADTQLKHVILLSDGKSEQTGDSYTLAGAMAQDKITVSTIAIGNDADGEAMQNMANLGMGRYYKTDDAGSLPRIFVKETFAASELIMEGNFRPVASGESEILSGVDTDQLPMLLGYVRTAQKESASMLIASETDDPILSVWQYGLGRSLAFTSDVRPRWAVEWLKWEDFSKFWSQAVGWSLAVPSGEFTVSASITGGAGEVIVDAVDSQGRFRNFLDFQVSVVTPNLSRETIVLRQSGPGRYEAEFDAQMMGTYFLSVREMKDGKVMNSRNTGVVASYSPEARDLETDYSLLENLAAVGGGKFKPEAGEIAVRGETTVWQLQDLWWLLVLISIPLFFLDVALRRITISKEQISELRNRLRASESGEISTTLTNLRRRKDAGLRIQDVGRSIQDKEDAPPARRSEEFHPAAESDEAYTSRLLNAKKRAERSKH